jgi:hypothetical protein
MGSYDSDAAEGGPMRILSRARHWWAATRPVDPETRAVMARRWRDLPASARTPAQIIGRNGVGCEGTHGVFPRCNLTCSPCYHSADANKVRVDGAHTVHEVAAQMALLRAQRGPRAHAQLIGGEVSLLDPDDHARTLLAMRAHGREPMSMTHGDFDAAYLKALVLDATGRPRLRRVSFATHFDSLMRGRRGVPRPRCEADLNPSRQSFVDMFRAMRRTYGVRYFLAHNMTVTPTNLDEIATTVADVVPMGYSMLSFQPAAFVGDARRWGDGYRDVGIDEVWAGIEAGMGQRIAHEALAFGDNRCNRTAFGFLVDSRWVPFLDPDRPADLAARDRFFAHLGGVNFGGTRPALLAVKLLRVLARHPGDLAVTLRWVAGAIRRAGGLRRVLGAARRGRVRGMTFVVHNFMDAADVAPAWQLMREGRVATDPTVRATQERLGACVYAMAHPETGDLVPACVQHSVLDPEENRELRRLLPLIVRH